MKPKSSRRTEPAVKTVARKTVTVPMEPVPKQRIHDQIAEAAYFLSLRRRATSAPTEELSDWLEAERTINQQLIAR